MKADNDNFDIDRMDGGALWAALLLIGWLAFFLIAVVVYVALEV